MYDSRIALPANVALTIFLVAALMAGYKLAFQNARWTEVSITIISGILVGGVLGVAICLIP